MSHILIVDDEKDFTSDLVEFITLKGHSAESAATLAQAREAVSKRMPSMLLLDLMLPDGNGLELLDMFDDDRPAKIVIITGHSGVKAMIGGMAGENVDYLRKPIEPRELLGMLNTLENSLDHAAGEDSEPDFGGLIGESAAMQALFENIRRVSATDSTVLIQGESGTGKELVAQEIHRLSGREGRFVPVNCGGLTKELISSQLFGHEKGSFTGASGRHAGFFEQADGGTLFLDEITEMPLDMQTHLLRALETGTIHRLGSETGIKVNARLLTATNQDPAEAVRESRLREDLYFRLRVFPILVPPLRERDEDILLLASRFLDDLNERHSTSKRLTDEACQQIRRHGWPGNVRELKHSIHRAYIMSNEDEVRMPARFDEDLPGDIEGLRVGRTIADVERDLILKTLEHFDNDKKAAAASLGISTRTLYNRLKEYDTAGAGT